MIILAARAHGVVAIDGVYNHFKDEAGLRAECQQGSALGFDGKSVHPAQLDVANDVFAPSEAAISLAQRRSQPMMILKRSRRRGCGWKNCRKCSC